MFPSSTPVGSRVEQTVDAAVRRRLLVEALEQSGWAMNFVLSGLVILMLFGSLIFRWQWLLVLALAGASLAAYRIRSRLLSRYAVAQILDRRLRLCDTLSTAFYLRSCANAGTGDAYAYQLAQAEKLATGIDTAQPFPFAGRRVWSVAGALAAVSLGLFSVRYMVTESLSLRPALLSFQIAPVLDQIHEVLAPKKRGHGLDAMPYRPAARAEAAEGKEAQASHRLESDPVPPPMAGQGSAEGSAPGQKAAGELAKSGTEGQGDAKPGAASLAKQETPHEASAAASSQLPDHGSKTSASQPSQTREQGASGENSSPGVVSRMKDALSSMMAKMQAASSPQQTKGSQQDATETKNNSQSQASAASQQGKQAQQQQSQSQASNPNESADGQAQGQTAEKQGTTQGKSSDQSAQKGSDAHSGVGAQDGDKGIKDAEQLKAMGKLAEIIGKRSTNLTGDMTVETSSGKQQQLKTSYSQRLGQHSDSGGEINRNQVPLAYRQYVREYMEEVRKQEKVGQ